MIWLFLWIWPHLWAAPDFDVCRDQVTVDGISYYLTGVVFVEGYQRDETTPLLDVQRKYVLPKVFETHFLASKKKLWAKCSYVECTDTLCTMSPPSPRTLHLLEELKRPWAKSCTSVRDTQSNSKKILAITCSARTSKK